jgi:ubiquinone/menaquinone biosynthesis C-methylase UbiE
MSNQVGHFYDDFNLKSNAARRNLRHYTLINRILKCGLRKNSRVLEIGCGSGQISIPLAKYASKGKYVGMDISPASIEYLNNKFKHKPNVNFICSDIANFKSDDEFDFIILADVLEHIPVENHEQVFQLFAKVALPHARVFINIPTAQLINWQRKNLISTR